MTTQQVTEYITEKVAELFDLLGQEADIEINLQPKHDPEDQEDQRVYLYISVGVQDGAELIGKHGARLQDLNTIVNMFLTPEMREYSLILDVNNYRQERTEYIQQVAHRNIEHTALTSNEVHLEPMLAWERRIVHMVASKRTDVTTESVGDYEDRHVVIKPVSAV